AIELTAEEIGAADHGLHIAGLRLDRDDAPFRRLAGASGSGGPRGLRDLRRSARERFQTLAKRLLGCELHRRIQCRVDVEPTLEDQVRTILGFQRLLDVVNEVLTRGAATLRGDQTEVGLRESLGL